INAKRLYAPTNAYACDGSPKMPVPMMQLITSATRSHLRTALTSPASFCICAVAVISYINLSTFADHPQARNILTRSRFEQHNGRITDRHSVPKKLEHSTMTSLNFTATRTLLPRSRPESKSRIPFLRSQTSKTPRWICEL